MAIHTIRCPKCEATRDMLYKMSQNPDKLAKGARCHACGKQGMKIDFSKCKLGAPVVSFRDGFFNIGTSPTKRGKYYSSHREMRNDAARNGINLIRG